VADYGAEFGDESRAGRVAASARAGLNQT